MKIFSLKKILSLFVIFVLFVIAIFFNFCDYFYKFDNWQFIRYSQINQKEDVVDYVKFTEQDINSATFDFYPSKKHFAGFVIYYDLENIDSLEQNQNLDIVIEKDGKYVSKSSVPYSLLKDKHEFYVVSPKNFNVNTLYKVHINNINKGLTFLQTKDYYNSKDVKNCNFLITPFYNKLAISSKLLCVIDLFLFVLFLVCIYNLTNRNLLKKSLLFFSCLAVFSSIYVFSFPNKDRGFYEFEKNSEDLVISSILAKRNQDYISSFGLVDCRDMTGEYYFFKREFLTDFYFVDGYSIEQPVVQLWNSEFIKDKAVVGNYLLFENGKKFEIIKTTFDKNDKRRINLTLNCQHPLNKYKYGSLANATFCDNEGNTFLNHEYNLYKSQVGLQGHIFKAFFQFEDHELMNLLCALLLAAVVSLIVILISAKYNRLFAIICFIVFAFAEEIVCYAQNLYWVPFTFFFPTLVGLFIAIYYKNAKLRYVGYLLAFLSILIKSLCGYEFLSTIMLSMILFLSVDAIMAFFNRDKDNFKSLLKVIFVVGILGCLGFIIAIGLHAYIRPGADGNIIKGLALIFNEDVARRSFFVDPNILKLHPDLEPYIKASVLHTIYIYFNFHNNWIAQNILWGFNFLSFKFLFVAAFASLFLKYFMIRKITFEYPFFVFAFITTISWYVLGKSHAALHVHMCFILWFFGFIQICFYTILSTALEFLEYIHSHYSTYKKISNWFLSNKLK